MDLSSTLDIAVKTVDSITLQIYNYCEIFLQKAVSKEAAFFADYVMELFYVNFIDKDVRISTGAFMPGRQLTILYGFNFNKTRLDGR